MLLGPLKANVKEGGVRPRVLEGEYSANTVYMEMEISMEMENETY
jgi:hypothetical protein